jgi:hypothetical protein
MGARQPIVRTWRFGESIAGEAGTVIHEVSVAALRIPPHRARGRAHTAQSLLRVPVG